MGSVPFTVSGRGTVFPQFSYETHLKRSTTFQNIHIILKENLTNNFFEEKIIKPNTFLTTELEERSIKLSMNFFHQNSEC